MSAIFARISRFIAVKGVRLGNAAIPRNLLEDAGARAGSNPRQARELRRAAFVYLSVVR